MGCTYDSDSAETIILDNFDYELDLDDYVDDDDELNFYPSSVIVCKHQRDNEFQNVAVKIPWRELNIPNIMKTIDPIKPLSDGHLKLYNYLKEHKDEIQMKIINVNDTEDYGIPQRVSSPNHKLSADLESTVEELQNCTIEEYAEVTVESEPVQICSTINNDSDQNKNANTSHESLQHCSVAEISNELEMSQSENLPSPVEVQKSPQSDNSTDIVDKPIKKPGIVILEEKRFKANEDHAYGKIIVNRHAAHAETIPRNGILPSPAYYSTYDSTMQKYFPLTKVINPNMTPVHQSNSHIAATVSKSPQFTDVINIDKESLSILNNINKSNNITITKVTNHSIHIDTSVHINNDCHPLDYSLKSVANSNDMHLQKKNNPSATLNEKSLPGRRMVYEPVSFYGNGPPLTASFQKVTKSDTVPSIVNIGNTQVTRYQAAVVCQKDKVHVPVHVNGDRSHKMATVNAPTVKINLNTKKTVVPNLKQQNSVKLANTTIRKLIQPAVLTTNGYANTSTHKPIKIINHKQFLAAHPRIQMQPKKPKKPKKNNLKNNVQQPLNVVPAVNQNSNGGLNHDSSPICPVPIVQEGHQMSLRNSHNSPNFQNKESVTMKLRSFRMNFSKRKKANSQL